jgi:HKD family nuclease
MKLIISPKNLKTTFQRLMNDYNEYHWSIAWASSSNPFFEDLKKYEDKIQQLVVGLHFYQTHPDFIEELMDNENVRFIEQVNGTFHPKSYLFYNDATDWKLLIGSPNFTKSAFKKNEEMTVLIKSTDDGATEVLAQFRKAIDNHSSQSIDFDNDKLSDYRTTWKNQQKKLKSLSGIYGGKTRKSKKPPKPPKLISNIPIMTMTWKDFILEVKKEVKNGKTNRIEMLDISQDAFQSATHFKNIPLDERKFIAGIPTGLSGKKKLWGYFGSMEGAGMYKKAIIQNPDIISKALDEIPLNGIVSKTHYDAYIKGFQLAFPCYKTFLATSTRLLAMKRPDVFVCVDSKNRGNLCKAFGITKVSLNNPDNYWEDVVMRIQDAEWYQNPTATTKNERSVEAYRAAFLDALYYERD